MKKHAPAFTRPVSRKFYASIKARVSESLGLIGRTDAVSTTMDCIDRYLTDGTGPTGSADPAVVLTFALLRSEIDKAVGRSARARRRRTGKTAPKTPTDSPESASQANAAVQDCALPAETDTSETEPDGEPEPFVPRNRRERRLCEQEARRAARRLVRRLTRA